MDVFCQRLDQEFDAQVVVTSPSVSYKASYFPVYYHFIKKYAGLRENIHPFKSIRQAL